MIGVGMITYQRPDYAEQSLKSLVEQLGARVDWIGCYNDGSGVQYEEAYQDLFETYSDVDSVWGAGNRGAAFAKNIMLRRALRAGCDWLFTMEDDIIVMSPNAANAYINASQRTKLHHLNFALHGPANSDGPLRTEDGVSYYPHCVGAWSFYTKECLLAVGLLDHNFFNAWDHVEHTARLAAAGLTSPFWDFADVEDSGELLSEIPGSIENSSIRHSPKWKSNITRGLDYWKRKNPETYKYLTDRGIGVS